jgi:2-polyprenyl-3-methyl-5-hydroxy-6-metoxy-1,4-benzoquinol methylase
VSIQNQHNHLIIEQFTKQAVPFVEMPEHSEAEAMRLLLKALELTPSETVLDVGCGPGLVATAIAPHVASVTGIDITPAMITQAEKSQTEKKLTNLSWQVADVNQLPFREADFSRVVSRYTFHHFLQPQMVLKEMIRVCQPGGLVVVADAFTLEEQEKADQYNTMEKLRDPSHTRALRRSELQQLFEDSGLKDIQISFYRLHMELEKILAASFPNPGDQDKLRQLFMEDLGVNMSGFEPYRDETQTIRFSFPIMVISGNKQ